eukprot:4633988-Pyramimonas_sp.AAC.1
MSQSMAAAEKDLDVFLTHDWGTDEMGRDNHTRVSYVNSALQTRGVKTWFDEDKMQGNIVDQMTDGIDRSVCTAVFVTKNYETKVSGKGRNGDQDNCKIELNYAFNHQGVKLMIPVVMEPGMQN